MTLAREGKNYNNFTVVQVISVFCISVFHCSEKYNCVAWPAKHKSGVMVFLIVEERQCPVLLSFRKYS